MLWPKGSDSNRILYVVGQLSQGGLERQLCYLLQGIDRGRYRPAVVVWSSGEPDGYASEIQSLGVSLHSFSGTRSPVSKLIALRRILQQLRPEVVHSFSFYTNYAAHFAARNTSALAIGSLRSDILADRRRVGAVVGMLSSRWPPDQVSNNLSTTEYIRSANSPFLPKRVHVVRNGIDLQRFRDRGRVGHNSMNIVGVGSLLPVKRWDRVLKAASALNSQGYRFQVRIAGQGPLRNSLLHQAEVLGVREQVIFLGHVSDIPKFISEGSFLVHTSDTEGCPNAVMEGMACGRAVIATRAGDVPYLVDDERTGFIVERGDESSLANRMAALIDDPELCCAMGERARSKAEREFGMTRFVEDMLAAYRASGWRDEPHHMN
ncbi:MAG: glycosyltransferase [Nitrospiraceae bacterium]